jgi:transposase
VHVAVALDEAGCAVARWRGPNSVAGWQGLAAWAATLGPDCRWGIEGAWNYGRGLAHRIALTQLRHSAQAQAYLARRVAEGKTKREALRALKRFIVRTT